MSVINQVLSQLEQRGVLGGIEQVRAIPSAPPPDRKMLWIALAILGGIILAALFAGWLLHRQAATPQAKSIPNVAVAPPVAHPPTLDAAAPVTSIVPAIPIAPVTPTPPVALIEPPTTTNAPTKPVATQALAAQTVVAKPLIRNKPVPAPPLAPSASTPPMAQPLPPPATLPIKQVSSAQLAEAEFNKAITAMQQGRVAEAIAGYETVLSLDPKHDTARQTLVALLLENRRHNDAERVLQDGVRHNPAAFAMLLARVQIERNALIEAVLTLEKSLPYAEKQADYQAFLAALQQRQDRHADAIIHYQLALQQAPNNGIWLMGLGISLQAVQRPIEAKTAFQRALNSTGLTPELRTFIQQRLRE